MIKVQNAYDIVPALSKYPRGKEKLKSWVKAEIKSSQIAWLKEANAGTDTKLEEVTDEQVENSLAHMFYLNPRDLYEFFDENHFPIEVYEIEGKFGFVIKEYSNDKEYNTRFEAEIDAYNTAFEMLEHVM